MGAEGALDRAEQMARLSEPVDVLVVGGGATGLGIALDGAVRGYRTALVEARDFAQATSSRSTKLIHGGVRYLPQGNVGLVREALHERGILLHNAPHLGHELAFLVPAYRPWELPYYGLGLKLYDLLAGSLRLTPSRWVGAKGACDLVPTVRREGLYGGIVYSDAQFNDARLALTLARTAAAAGAAVLNHTRAIALVKEGTKTKGAVVIDAAGNEREIRARVVVNATGIFSDDLRRLDDSTSSPVVAASQGIHLVLDRSFLPGDTAVMVPHTEDGRVAFIIPWQRRTLIGTTDTPVAKPEVEPVPLAEEVDFVLRHAGNYLARRPGRADVLAAFAGQRPLVRGSGATKALSRDHTLLVSPSGLVTITGGKWTTYRRMAAAAVDAAAVVAGLPPRACITRDLLLFGADAPTGPWCEFGLSDEQGAGWEARFPGRLHPNLPYSMGMAAFVVAEEMPGRLEDVLSRRLRALVLDARAAIACAPAVASLMAQLQNKDAAWQAREVADFNRLAQTYLV